MRIGVLTSLYPSPERPVEGVFAERRWSGMRARGHEVTLVQPLPYAPGPLARGAWGEIRRMPRLEERLGVAVERPRYLHVPGRARFNATRFARVGWKTLARRSTSDVVVADYAWPAAAAAPLARAAGVPFVIHGRGSDVLQVAGEAGLGTELAAHLRTAGTWCAVSQDLVEAMDRLGERPGHGRLVPNGVDLERFQPGDRAAARARLGLAPDGRLVLVVGHLIERKDPLLALAAIRAAREGCDEPVRAAFLGRGPLRDALAAATAGEPGVRLEGEVTPETLVDWYAAADVLLLTSKREGRPNVVLEALASGRPVVATQAGGTAELLAPFTQRMVADERTPAALAARLTALFADAPEPDVLRAAIAHLSWEASFEALEACLEEARGGQR